MKIPHTIPELVLRVYTRKLSPEQIEAEKKDRPLRSEDTNWDEEKSTIKYTLANYCLQEIIKSYPQLVEHVDETNRRHLENYNISHSHWEKEMENYSLKKAQYEMRQAKLDENLDDTTDRDDDEWEPLAEPFRVKEAAPNLQSIKSVLDQLNDEDRLRIVEEFDHEEISLDLALRTIPDEYYWKKLGEEKFPEAYVEDYGKSWKRLFVEKLLRETIEFFHPYDGNWDLLNKELKRLAPFAKALTLHNLIPTCYGIPRKPILQDIFTADEDMIGEEDEGFQESEYIKKKKQEEAKQKKIAAGEEEEEVVVERHHDDNSHIDLSLVLPKLKHIRKLSIIFTMAEMGLEYEPRLAEFTMTDCYNLAKALAESPTIQSFELQRSRVTDEQTKILVRDGLLHMHHLKYLNLSYNTLGDAGAKAIARLITDKTSRVPFTLHTLILTSCHIKRKGGKALGYGISLNNHLKRLVLCLNPIHDTGGRAVANALVEHQSLMFVDLSATHIGDPTCTVIGKMMVHNNFIRELNLSSNMAITQEGVTKIAAAIQENRNLFSVDLRLTKVAKEMENYTIFHLRRNIRNSRFPYFNRFKIFSKKEAPIPRPRTSKSLPESIEEEEESELEVIMKPKKSEQVADMIVRRVMKEQSEGMNTLAYDPKLRGKQLDAYIAKLEAKTQEKPIIKRKRRRNSHWDMNKLQPRDF